MQVLFEALAHLVLMIFVIIGVGGLLFLFLPEKGRLWLTEKYPPKDREP